MTPKQKLTEYLKSHNGTNGKTLYELGVEFGIQPVDTKRAAEDPQYAKDSIKKSVSDVWRSINKLVLVKQTVSENEVISEVYRKSNEPDVIDTSGLSIIGITTNPHGGAWIKYAKEETNTTEDFISQIGDVLKNSIIPYKRIRLIKPADKTLIIYGADKHIGAFVESNSVYKNEYNAQEARTRCVSFILEQVQRQVLTYGHFDKIIIMELGDALDGFNGKTTRGLYNSNSHTLVQNMNNREQFLTYINIQKELFDSLVQMECANKILFIATSNSNHGGDFEFMALKTVEQYLNLKYPSIKTFITVKAIDHFEFEGHTIIFGHGRDDTDMKSGFPLQLDNKTEIYISDYIDINKIQGTISFVSADLHQASESYGKRFRYRKVLSQFGNSKWAHTNFGSGAPGISFDIYYHNSSIIVKNDVFYNLPEQSNTGVAI